MYRRILIAIATLAATVVLLLAALYWPRPVQAPVAAPSAAAEALGVPTSSPPEPQTVALVGRVAYFDPDERPAAAIPVRAIPDHGGAPFNTISTDHGAFSLSLAPGTSYTLTADVPDGMALRNAPNVPTDSGDIPVLEIVPTSGQISGTVYGQDEAYWRDVVRRTQAASTSGELPDFKRMSGVRGTPLAGVIVEAEGSHGNVHATTDDQGHYRFSDLLWEDYVVRLAASDFPTPEPGDTNVSLSNGKNRDAVDFEIPPPSITFRGRVVDERGRPITGAALTAKWKTLNYIEENGYSESAQHEIGAESGTDGAFAFTDLPPMHPKDAAGYLQYGRASNVRIEARATGHADVEITVPPVNAGIRDAAMAYHEVHWREVGEAGPVQYAAVLPEPNGSIIDGIEIVLPAAAAIVCTAVDGNGRVVPQATIDISEQGTRPGTPNTRWRPSKPVDLPNGSKRFENLLAGEYALGAYADPLRAEPIFVTLAPGDEVTDVVLVLEGPGTGTVEGTVYDAETRKPIFGQFYIGAGDNMAQLFQTDEACLEKEGVGYRISNVPEGTQRVWFSGGSYASHVDNIEVRAGQVTRHDVYRYHGSAVNIRLIVNGEIAHKCEYVAIQHAHSDARQISTGGNLDGATAERDSFTAGPLEPGTHQITIRAYQPEGGTVARTFDVTVGESGHTNIDVAINGTAGVRGSVVGTGNGNLGSLRVFPQDVFEQSNEPSLYDALTVTTAPVRQPGNQFEAGHLDPGTYVVEASLYNAGGRGPDYRHQTVTLAEGEWADLTFDFAQP